MPYRSGIKAVSCWHCAYDSMPSKNKKKSANVNNEKEKGIAWFTLVELARVFPGELHPN